MTARFKYRLRNATIIQCYDERKNRLLYTTISTIYERAQEGELKTIMADLMKKLVGMYSKKQQ